MKKTLVRPDCSASQSIGEQVEPVLRSSIIASYSFSLLPRLPSVMRTQINRSRDEKAPSGPRRPVRTVLFFFYSAIKLTPPVKVKACATSFTVSHFPSEQKVHDESVFLALEACPRPIPPSSRIGFPWPNTALDTLDPPMRPTSPKKNNCVPLPSRPDIQLPALYKLVTRRSRPRSKAEHYSKKRRNTASSCAGASPARRRKNALPWRRPLRRRTRRRRR